MQEISERIDATGGQMLVSVIEIFTSLEMTEVKELHEQNCARTGGTSEATRVRSGKTNSI